MRAVAAGQSADARDVDDRPGPPRLHHPRRLLHADEHAALDHGAGRFVFGQRNVRNRSDHAADGRVVHQAIQPAPAFDRCRDRAGEIALFAHVEAHENRVGPELARERLALRGLDVAKRDAIARRGKPAHAGRADSARASGDQADRPGHDVSRVWLNCA